MSSRYGDVDNAIADQGMYTAMKWAMPFYSNFERGSHFGKHNSPVYFLILPFYCLFPGSVILLILQSITVSIGAWPVYLIARDRLGEKTGLCFALLYLLYHPIQGVNYDQFNELSFAVAPLLFSLYFFLKRRFFYFWIFFLLTLATKEDASFVAIFWGLYGLILSLRERRLLIHSVILIIIGIVNVYFSLYILLPYFQHFKYKYFIERYSHLGNNLQEAVMTIVTRPFYIMGILIEKPRILYFFEIFLPLAFVPFLSPGLLWMTIPTFMINMLSDYSPMHNTGSRYSAYIIPFVFGAAVLAVEKIRNLYNEPSMKVLVEKRLIVTMYIFTILCMLFVNLTPLRIGFNVPEISAHQKEILSVAKMIPSEASVSTQVDILKHVCQRMNVYASFREWTDYIFLDQKSKWYDSYSEWETLHSRWSEVLPKVESTGHYEKIYDNDGIKLYKLKVMKNFHRTENTL